MTTKEVVEEVVASDVRVLPDGTAVLRLKGSTLRVSVVLPPAQVERFYLLLTHARAKVHDLRGACPACGKYTLVPYSSTQRMCWKDGTLVP